MTYESSRRRLGASPEKIEVEGQTFSFVTRQRGEATAIYKSNNSFIRIGDAQRIKRDLALHRKMETLGFPVASILAEGSYGDKAYFIEVSLGDEHMGGIFAKDTERSGAISTKSFDAFVEIARQFAKAQLATASETKDFDAFSKGIHFDPLCEELPEYAPLLRKRFEEAKSRMSAMPFVLTHGDFNPNNLYPTGVIDLEDSFYGPYGYDIIGALSHIDSFPDSSEYEYFAKYRFTPEQKQKYLDSLDAVCTEAGRPKLTPLKEDFEFCRAVWLAVEIPHTPKLQRFRYDFVIKNFLD